MTKCTGCSEIIKSHLRDYFQKKLKTEIYNFTVSVSTKTVFTTFFQRCIRNFMKRISRAIVRNQRNYSLYWPRYLNTECSEVSFLYYRINSPQSRACRLFICQIMICITFQCLNTLSWPWNRNIKFIRKRV